MPVGSWPEVPCSSSLVTKKVWDMVGCSEASPSTSLCSAVGGGQTVAEQDSVQQELRVCIIWGYLEEQLLRGAGREQEVGLWEGPWIPEPRC